MELHMILDIGLVVMLLAFIGYGVKKGLVMMISKAVSVVGGMLGAKLIATFLKVPVAKLFFLSWIEEAIETSEKAAFNPITEMIKNGVTSLKEIEGYLMNAAQEAGLPTFSVSNVAQDINEKLNANGIDLLDASAQAISERIAFILVFVVSFLLIQLVVLIVFTNIDALKEVVVVHLVNQIGGGVLGFLCGGFLLALVLWLLEGIFPSLTADGALLSEAVLAESKLVSLLNRFTQFFFG